MSGPQQIAAGYESLADLDGFAWDWGGANHGRIVDVPRLVGFCLLIRRDVIEAIGGFDERFGVGCFEDDDYTLRAIQAGYRAVIAADAFVHHFGGRTFVGNGVDHPAVMRENQRRFREKWAGAEASPPLSVSVTPPRTATPEPRSAKREPGPFAVEIAPGGGLRLRRKQDRPRLSLCMIVRDSSRTLRACLETIRPWVDEMVIVDTGSLDDTPTIVEAYGGRLFHFPWCDDFSAARNESLRHAQGDWLFWMDSDDTIPAECGRKLRQLVEHEWPAGVFGFVMQVHCPGGSEEGGAKTDVTMVDHVKLFRNRPDLRFDGRIHEQILPAIRAGGGDVAWTELYVVHSGSDQSRAAQAKKLERDLRILERELVERPEHPFTLFNLGMTHTHASQYERAVDYLERGIARSGPDESHLRKAFALLVYSLMRLRRHPEAFEACKRGRLMFPRDVELRFREGVLLHEVGRLDEARQAYVDAIDQSDGRHFSSVDMALKGFKTRQNLAVLAVDMGDMAEAERQWREVLREVPTYRAGWRGLAETFLRRTSRRIHGPWGRAARQSRSRSRGITYQGTGGRQAGTLERRPGVARSSGRPAAVGFGDAPRRCQFFFDHGSVAEAEQAHEALLARDPGDASAYHNLGTLLMRSERYAEAVEAYRRSIELRPHHAATHLNMGYALKDCGRLDEAALEWEQTLRLAPHDPVALAELSRIGRPRKVAVE